MKDRNINPKLEELRSLTQTFVAATDWVPLRCWCKIGKGKRPRIMNYVIDYISSWVAYNQSYLPTYFMSL